MYFAYQWDVKSDYDLCDGGALRQGAVTFQSTTAYV